MSENKAGIEMKEYLSELKRDIKDDIGKIDCKVDKVADTVGQLAVLIAGQYVKKEDFEEHKREDKIAHEDIDQKISKTMTNFITITLSALGTLAAFVGIYFSYIKK